MLEPSTPAAKAISALPGAIWVPLPIWYEGFTLDCPTCGPQQAHTWSLDGWRTFLVECHCAQTPVSWAMKMGIRPSLLDAADRKIELRFNVFDVDCYSRDED